MECDPAVCCVVMVTGVAAVHPQASAAVPGVWLDPAAVRTPPATHEQVGRQIGEDFVKLIV
jgi:hypothetical protein